MIDVKTEMYINHWVGMRGGMLTLSKGRLQFMRKRIQEQRERTAQSRPLRTKKYRYIQGMFSSRFATREEIGHGVWDQIVSFKVFKEWNGIIRSLF